MNRPSPKAGNFGEGVIFALDDYGPFWKRVLIVAVDATLLFVPAFVGMIALMMQVDLDILDRESAGLFLKLFLLTWGTIAFVYLTVLEASDWGTVGMALTGTRIITLRGERPSILRMTFRLMLWLLGPIHPLWDMLWSTGDECCQTLRDKLAGTYVVRKRAVPIGRGQIRYRELMVFALCIPHLAVDRKTMQSAPPSARPRPAVD